MKVAKYVKKPIEIEAIQYLHLDNQKEYESFVDDGSLLYDYSTFGTYIRNDGVDKRLRYGDFIIKGVNGEFYPCREDVFYKTYEKVEDNG